MSSKKFFFIINYMAPAPKKSKQLTDAEIVVTNKETMK